MLNDERDESSGLGGEAPTRIMRRDRTVALPAYQTAGAAGFDLAASVEMTVAPGEVALVPTGLVIRVPDGYFLGIFARSSTPLRRGLIVSNGVGVIDADYCGAKDEIKIQVMNMTREPVTVMVGDRICLLKMQAEIAQYDTPDAILTRPASDYVREFLGRERLVRRMAVEAIHPDALEHPASGPRHDEPRVPLTSTLSEAFSSALASPTEQAAVFDGERYVGAFTATSLLESLRLGRPEATTPEGGSQVATGI